MSVNKVILVGNLGKDAEVFTPAGGDRSSCKFTVATSERFRTQTGELKEETTWHNVVYWLKNDSGLLQYLKKGTMVYVDGSITNRQYTTQSGETKYITEIKAARVELIGGKPQSAVSQQQGPYQANGMPNGNYKPQQFAPAPQQPVYPQNNPAGFQQTGMFPQQPVNHVPLYEQAQQMGQPKQPTYSMPPGFEDLPG